jgi:hypothetical protein
MIQRHEKKDNSRIMTPKLATDSDTKLHDGIRTCEVCGNDYDKPLEIVHNGISHYFDCFECAIHAMAPKCAHCDCRIIGHGHEAGGTMFCCAHCAQQKGVMAVKDRV